jgi:trehalose utilization protein
MVRVTVWNENVHEKNNPQTMEIYPEGIHTAIAKGIQQDEFIITTATLEQPEHGLTHELLDNTDVLIWWGHKAHQQVEDEIVERVYRRVLEGMGLIVLHSGHFSKIFKKLMGTTCDLKWRLADEKERLWVVNPAHPIADGIGQYIELEKEEMYGEHFDIPSPEELVFVSWFEGGEVFRSGCTYHRGQGKIFYFRPGHETYPTYHNQEILRVISNAVKWTAPKHGAKHIYGNAAPLEAIKVK